jgi:hypothetical protein
MIVVREVYSFTIVTGFGEMLAADPKTVSLNG